MADIFILFMFLLCFFICTFTLEGATSGIRAWFKHLDWMGSITGKMKNKG